MRSLLLLVASLLAWAAAAAASGCDFNAARLPASTEPAPRLLMLPSSALSESADSAASKESLSPPGGLLAYSCPGLAERRYSVCLPGLVWQPALNCPQSPAPPAAHLPSGVCRVPGLPSEVEAELLPVWSNLTASAGQTVYVDCLGADAVLLGPRQWTCLPGVADSTQPAVTADEATPVAGAAPEAAAGRWDRGTLPKCVRRSIRCQRPAAATAERCLNPACDFYFADSVAVFTCGGRQTAHLCQANGTWYPGTESLCGPAQPSVQASSPTLLATLAWVLAPCAVLALLLLAAALALLALRRARFLRRRRARRNAAAAAIVAAAGGSAASLPPPLTPSASGSREAGHFDDFDYFSYVGAGGGYYDDFDASDLLLDSSSGRRSFPRASSSSGAAAYDDGGDLVRLLSAAARPPSYEETVAADNPAASAIRGSHASAAAAAASATAAAAQQAAATLASRSFSGAQSRRRRPRPLQSPGPPGGGLCDGDSLSTSTAVSLPAPTASAAAGPASPLQQQQAQQQQQSQCRSSLETMAFSDGTSVTLPTLGSASSRSLASNRPLCGSVGKPADCADGAA